MGMPHAMPGPEQGRWAMFWKGPWGESGGWGGRRDADPSEPMSRAEHHGEGGGRRRGRRRGPFGGPGGPGGPFPPGPFGPFMFGGFHGGPGGPPRRPRVRRGDVRAGILLLLAERERNGYQLIRELAERSHGMWRPSPGSVYPALQQLEEEGLVQPAENGFTLTQAGRDYLEERAGSLTPPWEIAAESVDESAYELHELLAHLHSAAAQVSAAGSPAQIEAAQRVLRETRRSLYRILADEPGDEGADGERGEPAES